MGLNEPKERSFYVPENPNYTIFDSARDSVRFAVLCLEPCGDHWRSKSSFVDLEGNPQNWHDFGTLEGPGWAANAVGGALELYRFGRFVGDELIMAKALGLIEHVINCGFLCDDGFILPYRETDTGRFVLNFKHNNDWFCPGSIARIGYQMLLFADELSDDRTARFLIERALWCATWLAQHIQRLPNGWFPRRVTPEGEPYPYAAEAHSPDPIFDCSGDAIQMLQLWVQLAIRDLIGTYGTIADVIKTFMAEGGFFGSVNHDTYDRHENVAYALAFRTLLQASQLLELPQIRDFAYNVCLKGLDKFKMSEDRNSVATKGLLLMEESWNTAYLWENAEAASAYLDAFADTGEERFLSDALTILRATAKHHYGDKGFLTEGVDWDNVVGSKHHIDGAEFGAIRYTEPLLNNLHIVEPTLNYLERWATKRTMPDGRTEFYDHEGNLISTLPSMSLD
ncbi:MAG: hypothetical protein NZ805_05610 [Armatimonadetes bacterium]|nr:hypothetical protein [Armatimonadota bacterium]MDW8028491.1 hypothetical protein [Armatimonadota bacterium]